MRQYLLPVSDHGQRHALMVSRHWVQAAILILLFGFFVLGFLAYSTYTCQAPIPEKTVDPLGALVFTRADVIGGQKVFLRNGLMEYGSIFWSRSVPWPRLYRRLSAALDVGGVGVQGWCHFE